MGEVVVKGSVVEKYTTGVWEMEFPGCWQPVLIFAQRMRKRRSEVANHYVQNREEGRASGNYSNQSPA